MNLLSLQFLFFAKVRALSAKCSIQIFISPLATNEHFSRGNILPQTRMLMNK